MELEDIINKIQNVSKEEIKRVAPDNCNDIKEMILRSEPSDPYEKMVVGYLTSLCAEYIHPETLSIEKDELDYVGFELDGGSIEITKAGNMLGTCMRNGKIVAGKAGDETGKSMAGGVIVVPEIKSIGNTIGGRIETEKVEKVSKDQGAEIFIRGTRFRRSLLDRLLGR